eukprot:m51a1_g9780 putative C-tail anchored protein (389) ;mRNA; r:1682401-1684066
MHPRCSPLLLLLLAASAALLASAGNTGDDDIWFVGNVSGAADEASWHQRVTGAARWSRGAFFYSRSLDASVNASSQSAAAHLALDSIWAIGEIPRGLCPISWLSYFDVDVDLSHTSDWAKLDVSSVGGFTTIAALAIVERDPNNNVIQRASLRESADLWYNMTEVRLSKHWKTVEWMAFSRAGWMVKLKFIVSDVIGVINQANAVVAPRSLVVSMDVFNWPYRSTRNFMSLVYAAAVGNETWDSHTVVTNKGATNNVYFSLSNTAIVDGRSVEVDISGFSNATWESTFESLLLRLQMFLVFKDDWRVKTVEVAFPAGAKHVSHSVALGNGVDPTNAPRSTGSDNDNGRSSHKTAVAVAVTLGVALVVVVAVVAVVMARRSSGRRYSSF